jgi:hypothetical protein
LKEADDKDDSLDNGADFDEEAVADVLRRRVEGRDAVVRVSESGASFFFFSSACIVSVEPSEERETSDTALSAFRVVVVDNDGDASSLLVSVALAEVDVSVSVGTLDERSAAKASFGSHI